MQLGGATFRWAGGLLALCLAGVLTTPGGPPADSTGAHIGVERDGNQLRVRALFAGAEPPADTLSYKLTVSRSGATGTTQTTQSGVFSVTPGRPDTLSTVQVNVQTGDHLRVHLRVRAGTRPVDTAHLERSFS